MAIGFFNIGEPTEGPCHMSICFDDLGIHSESGLFLKITDAITGEELGTFQDAYTAVLRRLPVSGCHRRAGSNREK